MKKTLLARVAFDLLTISCLAFVSCMPDPDPTKHTPVLVANAGGPYGPFFSERPVTFSAVNSTSSPNPIARYLWTFGDGTPEVDQITPQHTYRKSGPFCSNATYNVDLTIVDTAGNRASARTTATITQVYASTTACP